MLLKPSRYERDVRTYDRRLARDRAKRAEARAAEAAWAARARECYERDHGHSRASGVALKYRSGPPQTIADPHHILFRSAGGTDDLSNLVTLSRSEHDRVHRRGHYATWLDVSGDANHMLTFTETDAETGRFVHEWTSPCPSSPQEAP